MYFLCWFTLFCLHYYHFWSFSKLRFLTSWNPSLTLMAALYPSRIIGIYIKMCLFTYLYIYRGMFRAYSNVHMKSLQKLLTAYGYWLFSQKLCLGCLTGFWMCLKLFLLSYLSIIHLLLYLFIHLLLYLLISVYVSRVYILKGSCYYSHILACFIIFV